MFKCRVFAEVLLSRSLVIVCYIEGLVSMLYFDQRHVPESLIVVFDTSRQLLHTFKTLTAMDIELQKTQRLLVT